ncbi:Cellulose-growth-specific protein [Lachnellula arida]|uniref:AA9 family lytic polysaccharide monooxygenase n=1 Tax=Lachnellula arida TaxID=1316785 RepID=A0A8T9B1S0_9HELO|nr:Cellulose-growth-specific protein [Lachnellula arida]
MLFCTLFSAGALLVAETFAHGAVTSYVIGGTTYPGYTGFSPASSPPTIQRQWPDHNPTLSVTAASVKCNGGTSAALNASVHRQCAGDFSACDGSGTGWFKIDQMGMTGTSWGTAVTSTVQPGSHLIRHELLALHQADTPQFYAECAQVVVTGSGAGTPSGGFLATVPGYASEDDPGITIDIYSSTATTYTPPGPAVWTG